MRARPKIDHQLPSGLENMHTRLIDMLKEQNDWAKEAEQEIVKLKAENDKDCKYHLEVENQLQDEIIKLKQKLESHVCRQAGNQETTRPSKEGMTNGVLWLNIKRLITDICLMD